MGAPTSVDLSRLKIDRIERKECLRDFQCGVRDIDRWAVDKAFKLHQQDRARVFCIKAHGVDTAIAFYSLSLNHLGSSLLLRSDQNRYRDTAPFAYIDWFAVHRLRQSHGIGKIMMIDALRRLFEVSKVIPFYGVALRSLNDETTLFYRKHGFVIRTNEPHPIMILPIWTIKDLFSHLN